jgi:UDP-glucose 4-epimerase
MAGINVLTSSIRHGVKKLIFTSSIAVYGKAQLPYKETDKPEPEDLYGIGKLAFEESLKVMSRVHGIEYVILRPHNVYGPKQSMADPFRNVVTIFMNACLNEKPHVLYGEGKMVRCFTYIDDIVQALYKSLDLSGVTINVGSPQPHTVKELSDLIINVSKIKVAQEMLPPRPQEIMEAISDHTLSDKIFKIKPTPLEEGIKQTWKWVKNQPPVIPVYSNLEIVNDKLPVNWRNK